MARTFGFNGSRGWLADLKKKAALMKDDELNETLALECAVAAWSLCDWVFEEHGANLGFKSLRELQDNLKMRCVELSYMQDICTERKHSRIGRYTPSIEKAILHRGAFSREFSREFDTSGLEIHLPNGGIVYFEEAIASVASFWEEFFNCNHL